MKKVHSSVKAYKGLKVYKEYNSEAYAVVNDVYFKKDDNRIFAFLISTLSLVPMHKVILVDSISMLSNGGVYLRQSCEPMELADFQKSFRNSCFTLESIRGVSSGSSKMKLNDICFNSETGEITDVVISKKKFTKKNKVSINKIVLKDNTIYVE